MRQAEQVPSPPPYNGPITIGFDAAAAARYSKRGPLKSPWIWTAPNIKWSNVYWLALLRNFLVILLLTVWCPMIAIRYYRPRSSREICKGSLRTFLQTEGRNFCLVRRIQNAIIQVSQSTDVRLPCRITHLAVRGARLSVGIYEVIDVNSSITRFGFGSSATLPLTFLDASIANRFANGLGFNFGVIVWVRFGWNRGIDPPSPVDQHLV